MNAKGRADLVRALELAAAGDWEGAHAIVQQDEADPIACWIHAVVHKAERDEGNSRYWYRRSGRTYDALTGLAAELAAITAALSPERPPPRQTPGAPL